MSDFTDSRLILSTSCVTYYSSIKHLTETLNSLNIACEQAKTVYPGLLCELYIIDNGSDDEYLSSLHYIKSNLEQNGLKTTIYFGHGNIGYGKGNNLAINATESNYHLILNPDVVMDKEAVMNSIEYIQQNRTVALVSPQAFNADGSIQYIAKRSPGLSVLALRGFAPTIIKKFFQKSLGHYEYRDRIPSKNPVNIEIASGCFMFCDTKALKTINGFSPKYFMYFEDFDLSKRLGVKRTLTYLPTVQISHRGGNASKKGLKHAYLFLTSCFRYFHIHGLRLF